MGVVSYVSFFFFSSRRRHTRFDCDWSSDVCSSDLIQLVDYDGMWVPALSGRDATEIGHRAYQHPERSGQDYGQEIDRFSALVIYLSLAALERDATLWERFHTGDNLIFVREDFLQVGRSAIWQQLGRIGSREIDQLAAALAAMVQQHPMKVGNLDSVLKTPPS